VYNYKLKEILGDSNLLFDLKYDYVFKKIFLDYNNKDYLVLIISKLLNIEYDKLDKYLCFGNIEIPSNKLNNKSSYMDLVCKYSNKNIIIEMNNFKTNRIINKNYYYLFKQHLSRSNNKNSYGKNRETILINIDNYDVIGRNDFIYESKLRFKLYNNCIYKNIKILHINLATLKYKYYNKFRLNEIEKIFIIFIEQRKDKIREVINKKEIEGVIRSMDRLKFDEINGFATYDREEYEKMLKEEFERDKKRLEKEKKKLEINERELEENQKELEENQKELEENQKELEENQKELEENQKELAVKEKSLSMQEKNLFNNKISFAKELKLLGIPIERIVKLTDLTIDQIKYYLF